MVAKGVMFTITSAVGEELALRVLVFSETVFEAELDISVSRQIGALSM
jgi:hypothetical protein